MSGRAQRGVQKFDYQQFADSLRPGGSSGRLSAVQRQLRPVVRSAERSGVQLTGIRFELLTTCLLAMSQASARELAITLDWNDDRTVIDHIEPRSKTRVWTGADGRQRHKGRLGGITTTGLVVLKSKTATSLESADVHSIKVFPSKTHNRGNRRMIAVLSAPIACGSSFASWILCLIAGGPNGDELCTNAGPVMLIFGSMIAVPWTLWRVARGADRGAIRIILNKGTKASESTQ